MVRYWSSHIGLEDKPKKIMELKPYLFGIVLLTFFVLSMSGFAFNFLSLNNPNSTIFTDNKYSFINKTASESLANFSGIAQVQKTAVEKDYPTPIYLFLMFIQAFTVPINFMIAAVSMFGSLISSIIPGLFSTDANSPIIMILGVINSLMLVALVFAVIAFIRSGRGDR